MGATRHEAIAVALGRERRRRVAVLDGGHGDAAIVTGGDAPALRI